MEKKNIVTRFDEVRLRVDDPKQMVGKMTAQAVCRTWQENFLDKDTGDVVSIDRSEWIIPVGRILTTEDVAQIQFHQQAGELNDVLVTNQLRPYRHLKSATRYEVTVNHKHKEKMLVYAEGISMALDIAIDYCEQEAECDFRIVGIKRADARIIIPYAPEDEEGCCYHIVVAKYYDKAEMKMAIDSFLVFCKDADQAIDITRSYIIADENRLEYYGDCTFESVKQSSITTIIPMEMSEVYIKQRKLHDTLMNGERIYQRFQDS